VIATVSIDITVDINRPLEEVFEFVSNPNNVTHWVSPITGVKQEGSGPMGIGTRFKQTGRFLGKTFEMTSEVTAWEPNRKFSMKSVSGPFPFEQTTAFSRHGDVTRLDAHMEGESKGFFKLADSLVGAMGRRTFAADYANLKDLMEAGVAASTGKQQAPT
jgi:ligand-binding SRPBCC domain-containing protein